MDDFIRNLPAFIGKEIFSYILPDPKDITFIKFKGCYNLDYYNPRYEKAYFNDYLCENEDNKYLSRIFKKNGKHRYYISHQLEDVMETEYNDRIYNMYMYEYKSIYVGKDLESALLELFYPSISRNL